jgi:hypothetical protein
MSFTQSILLELVKAILAGSFAAAVFVFGQATQRFFFDPISEMRKVIGRIGHDLVFYRNTFSSPPNVSDEKWAEATSAYRAHASALRSLPLAIPFYDWAAKIASLPSRHETLEASKALIGISNMSRNPSGDEFTWKNDQFKIIHSILVVPPHEMSDLKRWAK